MRPIELTISAFCSYTEKQTLRLDKLGEKGVYVITGDTGAGKTTIFDAITFALYSETSGNVRDKSMLRSKLADPKEPTVVRLVFEHRGRVYTVERGFKVQKKRDGSYEAKQTPYAELTFDDDAPPIADDKNVTKKIVEILGINREQFSKISMIAQGDFQKVLIAKTAKEREERKDILRRLFGTERFERFGDRLRGEEAALKKDLGAVYASIKQSVSELRCPEDSELYPQAERIKEGAPAAEALELLEKLIALDEKQESELSEQTEALAKQSEQLTAQIEKAAARESVQKSLAAAQEALLAQRERHDGLKAAHEAQQARLPEAEALSGRITIAQEALKKYEELEAESAKARAAEEKINSDEAQLIKQREAAAKLAQAVAQMKEEAEAVNGAQLDYVRLCAEGEKLAEESKKIALIKSEHARYQKLTELLKNAQKEYAAAKSKEIELRRSAEQLELSFFCEQAGIIAEQLVDGRACPVCGSTVHPQKAHKSDSAPTQAEVEQAKKSAQEAQDKAHQKELAHTKASADLAGAENTLKEKLAEVFGECPTEQAAQKADERLSELAQQKKQLDEKTEQANAKAARSRELSGLIPEKENSLAEKKQDIAELEKKLEGEKGGLKSLLLQIEAQKAKLEHPDKAAAEKALGGMTRALSELRSAIDAAAKAFSDCEKNISKLSGSADSLKQQLLSMEETADLRELSEKKSAAESKLSTLRSEGTAVNTRIEINRQKRLAIAKRGAEYDKVSEKLAWVSELAETVMPRENNKAQKSDLETYILMNYFDRVIGKANVHFLHMTAAKFELVQRVADEANGKLQLDVRNTHEDVVYGVESLSGGEQFVASLSLALGLSEVVQETAGGIRLDTMFVDEGFGTLDGAVLRRAMEALSSLADGNRLVGLISHVPELSNMLDKKIVVTKTDKGGSTAEIIV